MQQVTAQPAVRRNRAGRLGAYLAAGVGAGAVGTTAEAGVVTIDVSSVSGINGGVPAGSSAYFYPTPSGKIQIYNGQGLVYGLDGDNGFFFAALGSVASPIKLTAGSAVNSSLSFQYLADYTAFRYNSAVSSDFGPGSYMGFRDAAGRFGYFEVLWDSATTQFQILSGAYESVAGVAIVIPNAAPAVPEPSTLGLMALGAAGLLAARARQRKAQVEPSTP